VIGSECVKRREEEGKGEDKLENIVINGRIIL
jgi:hypothetical protein